MNRYISAMVVIAALLFVVVTAEAEMDAGKDVEQEDNPDEQSTDVEEGRIRKHLFYSGLRKSRF